MTIQEGDTVKIITANSIHEGSTGKVVRVFEDEKTCTVQIESRVSGGTEFETAGVITGFYMTELELVESTGRDGQIQKIASVLYNEPGNEDWDMEQSVKAATSLYNAGVRFNA